MRVETIQHDAADLLYITIVLYLLRILKKGSSFDFSTFVITGPSTSSVSVGLALAGEFNPGGIAVADATQCLTDTFSITNQVSVPVICGTNTGYHGKKCDKGCKNLIYLVKKFKIQSGCYNQLHK